MDVEKDRPALFCLLSVDTVQVGHTKPWLCRNPFCCAAAVASTAKGQSNKTGKYLSNSQSGTETVTSEGVPQQVGP